MSEAFLTTVIGSLPKPRWLMQRNPVHDQGAKQVHGKGADWALEGAALEEALDDAVRIAVHDQVAAGIDIISDGEQRRKSWMTYVTARMEGFDYDNLVEKWTRNRRRLAPCGQCVGAVQRVNPILERDSRFLQRESPVPFKITLPGPLSIADSTFDAYYGDERAFALALAEALNAEAKALDALGPAVIQFDEPAFSRYPDKVAEWGIEALERCIDGIQTKTTVHICYSYPMPGVPRPIVDSYPVILEAIEHCSVDQVALEFEESRLRPELLRLCPSKTVLFGCISNNTDEIESPEHVASKLLAAAEHLPADQIQAAPDCGLVPLGMAVSRAKLRAMVEGAHLARARHQDGR